MTSPSSSYDSAQTEASQTSSSRNTILIGVLLLSALYFADTLLRASLKTFWYDELVTVYLCKLPTFGATWAAVLHGGADLNPPLLYLLTRWSQYLFGEGLISTRLPELLGFWVFTLCLYRFVSRRLGPLRGAIAALFPVFTLAHYYAYEARPHGILLGSFGLMMLCWQRAREGRKAVLWAFLLWLSYLSGLLIHIYAVYLLIPFLFAEGATLLRRSRPHLGIVAALLLAPPCVLPLYYRLYANFRSSGYSGMHIHLYELVQHFFVFVLGPALAVILFLILLLAWRRRENNPAAESPDFPSLSVDELNLALGLILMPIIGVIGIKISHAYYFDRYFLAATAGYALLVAQTTLVRGGRAWVARGLFAFMIALLSADTLVAAYCRWHHADIDQIEPSSHIIFDPSPAAPLLRNAALLRDTSNLDILVRDEPGFLYLYYYAPPQIRKRLVFGAPRNDAFDMRSLDGYQRLARWAHVDLRLVTYDEFFATHDDFLVYTPNNVGFGTGCSNCTEKFLNAGYTLRSVEEDPYNLLEHFSK
ncbi:MAG TPA: glycosyltransferase family 39 protein [Acidobacteriaceae bacterium]